MMRPIVVGALLLLGACAETQYDPPGRDFALATVKSSRGTYDVDGTSLPTNRAGFAGDVALHRAAQLARAEGFRFMQIIRYDPNALAPGAYVNGLTMAGGPLVRVRARGVASLDAPIQCEMEDTAMCRNVDIEELLARLTPGLGAPTPR